eukprot:110858_1
MSLSDQQTIEALQIAWKQFIDSKDEGIIDFEEWNDSVQRLNCGLTQTQIKNTFNSMDTQNSGHIDQTDFIRAVSTNNNSNFLIILKSIISNNNTIITNGISKDEETKLNEEDDIITIWRNIFNNLFDGLNTITQDVWVNKILALNIDSVTDDNLRLFHAVLDSRFRSCFDFDEFYETFTIHSLHHKQMDLLRDAVKNVLLPKPKVKTKEISIQTDPIRMQQNKPEMDEEVLINREIEDLEQFVIEEEKYVNIMDKIDSLKQQNGSVQLFKWDAAYKWKELQVCNWLNEIGFEKAEYINVFYDKKINGYILLNGLNIDIMMNELNINEMDALLIDKCIFILRKKFIDQQKDENKEMERRYNSNDNNNNDGAFYKRKCQHLTRELVKMKKIERMFKQNRRETESKVKQLECNLYFGSLNQSHLMQKFDINQLFQIQTAYHKTLLNIQQCIQAKVNKKGNK